MSTGYFVRVLPLITPLTNCIVVTFNYEVCTRKQLAMSNLWENLESSWSRMGEWLRSPSPTTDFRNNAMALALQHASNAMQEYSAGRITRGRFEIEMASAEIYYSEASSIPETNLDFITDTLEISSAVFGAAAAAGKIAHASSNLVARANYAQKYYSEIISKGGAKFFNDQLGIQVKTIDDLASAIKSGTIQASDVSITVVSRGDDVLILNTRSAEALQRAGVPRSQWRVVDGTGDAGIEARLDLQLKRNNLSNSGTNSTLTESKFRELHPDDYADIQKRIRDINHCFAAGTLVEMADGLLKPIERIVVGDEVLAYDDTEGKGRGGLAPRRVTHTFCNPDRILLDFHGLLVTPGHAFLCGDGPHEGRHRMLIDILRDDGAIVARDGCRLRAATNCQVGSEADQFVELAYVTDPEEQTARSARLRAGTLLLTDDGETTTVLDCLTAEGYRLLPDGFVAKPGEAPHPLYWYGEPPRPEDYVLKKSGLTDADLEETQAEESQGTDGHYADITRPFAVSEFVGETTVLKTDEVTTPTAPTGCNRRERRRLKAQARKHRGETLH